MLQKEMSCAKGEVGSSLRKTLGPERRVIHKDKC